MPERKRRSTGGRVRRRWASWSCLVVLLTSCGSPGEASAVRAAEEFHAAAARGDGVAACAMLSARTVSELEQSSGKPCAEAILDESVPEVEDPPASSVYGNMAQLRYPDEVVFLSRFDDGWKITAAGCTRIEGGRYDCRITGG